MNVFKDGVRKCFSSCDCSVDSTHKAEISILFARCFCSGQYSRQNKNNNCHRITIKFYSPNSLLLNGTPHSTPCTALSPRPPPFPSACKYKPHLRHSLHLHPFIPLQDEKSIADTCGDKSS